ncbi:MAG: hypothetical protein ACYDA6_10715 [Solirubrobacteraceae bacterium]
MSAQEALPRLLEIVDASGAAQQVEAMLPVGVRPRQLSVRTLLLGVMLALSDSRPAHLRRVHEALVSLPEVDRWRLGVIVRWSSAEHELTYRQVERTFGLVVRALAKERPDGRPSPMLSKVMDALLEASVQVAGCPDSSSLAIDWSAYESHARAGHGQGRRCTDSEAAFGHRTSNSAGEAKTFFGYYLQAATMVREEGGEAVPELLRRITLASCSQDPPAQIVPVMERMREDGVALGDLLADCGYSYRAPETFALPARAAGAGLVMDLHPNDRGQKGTYMGAVICNGNLYCPATPKALLGLSPLAPAAGFEEAAAHERRCSELARYKLSPISAADGDGYRRVGCPAVRGKLRCPLREQSMALSHERPTVSSPPEQPPVCCSQQTITVPAAVNAKSAQKHDYPSAEHRRSYARRSAAERSFARVFDPAATDIRRGWCRLMGLTPNALLLACAFVVTNIRVADSFALRCAEDERRRRRGLPPRRRRRRHTLHDIVAAANSPPA